MTVFTSTWGANVPMYDPATKNINSKSYIDDNSTGVNVDARVNALMFLAAASYVTDLWSHFLIGGRYDQTAPQHLDATGIVFASDTFEIARTALISVDGTPANIKEFFPDSNMYRFGHYAWVAKGADGSEFLSDVGFLRFPKQIIKPPQGSYQGLFVHLYPGVQLDVVFEIDTTDPAHQLQVYDSTYGWKQMVPLRNSLWPL